MANSKQVKVVKLGGELHKLRYDMNALVALEEALGTGIDSIDKIKHSFRTQRAMVWAALLDAEPEITLKQVGDWLTPLLKDAEGYGKILDAVGEAYGAAFPEVKEPQPEPDPNPPAATGTGSSSES